MIFSCVHRTATHEKKIKVSFGIMNPCDQTLDPPRNAGHCDNISWFSEISYNYLQFIVLLTMPDAMRQLLLIIVHALLEVFFQLPPFRCVYAS